MMTQMAGLKKWLRRGFKGVCIAAVAFVLLSFSLVALLRIEPVRYQLFKTIATQIEKSSGWRLEADSITDLSAFHWKLSGVRLIQQDQIPVTIRSLEIELSPYRLALGKIVLKELLADSIWVKSSQPASSLPIQETPLSSGFPKLSALSLLSLEISHLHITDLHLQSDTVLGKRAFNVEGELEISPFRHFITTDLVVTDSSERVDPTFISLQAYKQAGRLVVETRLVEPRKGMVNSLTETPHPLAFDLEASASTPWEKAQRWLAVGTLPPLSGEFFLETDGLPLEPSSPLKALLQDTLAVQGSYAWRPNESLSLTALEAVSHTPQGALRLAGHLLLDEQFHITESELHGLIEEVAVLEPITHLPMSGSLHLRVELNGPLLSPSLAIDVASDALHLRELTLQHPQMYGKGTIDSHALHFDTHLSLGFGSLTATASSLIDWDYQDTIKFTNSQIHLPETNLHGDITFSLLDAVATGKLEGHVSDLNIWSSSIGYPLHGHSDLLVTLQREPGTASQAVDITATGSQLQFSHLLKGALLAIHLHISELDTEPKGTLSFTGQEITTGDLYFSSLTANTVFGKASPHAPFQLNAKGRWHGDFNLAVQARYLEDTSKRGIAIEALSGMWGGQSLKLATPAELVISSAGAELNPFTLQLGQGTIEGRGTVGFEEVNLALKAKSLSNERLHALFPEMPATGTLSGEVLLLGPKTNPRGKFQVTLNDVTNPGYSKLPAITAHITGDLQESKLNLLGEVKGMGNQPFSLNATLPLSLSLENGLSAQVHPHEPIFVSMQANGEISPFIELLPDPPTLSGNATIVLTVKGTLEKPDVTGTLTLHRATFEAVGSGIVLRNLEAQFEGTGDTIALKNLSGEDGEGGRITGTGYVKLDPETHYPFDITLNTSHAVMLRREFVKGIASGEIHFKGDAAHAALTGSLTADEVAVQIPKQKPVTVANVDVKYVNTPPEKIAPPQAETSLPLLLDISLVIPGNFFVNGNDLDSEWRGNIKISGNSQTPLLDGELNLVQGDFRVNGKALTLEKGKITFAGELEKATNLYVLASQDIDRVTVEAILKGPIKAPKLALRSSPPMSQREILSYLILNHGLTENSPFENDQMADEALDLNTTSTGSDQPSMLSRLRRIGIDRIDIDNKQEGDNNNVSVKVGKYLSKGLFVGVKRGFTDESNRFSVEADVIRNVKLQAEVQDDASSKMLLMWKHDY